MSRKVRISIFYFFIFKFLISTNTRFQCTSPDQRREGKCPPFYSPSLLLDIHDNWYNCNEIYTYKRLLYMLHYAYTYIISFDSMFFMTCKLSEYIIFFYMYIKKLLNKNVSTCCTASFRLYILYKSIENVNKH